MSWVRYDDGFDSHPKTTAVIAEDPGAIALHLLANTWSSKTKRPGFVPAHQPGVLLADKRKANKWAALLVKAGLWHEVEGGYEFHDHVDYRAPARERSTPGTPAELSAKRQAAGRKGGQQSAKRREQGKQAARANAANDVSKPSKLPSTQATKASNASSNSVSPVVSSSTGLRPSEELTPEPVPPSAGADAPAPNAGDVVAAWIEGSQKATGERPANRLIAQVGRQARELIDEGKDPARLVDVARSAGVKGYADLGRELLHASTKTANGRPKNEPYRNPDDPSAYQEWPT